MYQKSGQCFLLLLFFFDSNSFLPLGSVQELGFVILRANLGRDWLQEGLYQELGKQKPGSSEILS